MSRLFIAILAAAGSVAIGTGQRRAVPERLAWQASSGPFAGVVKAFAEVESGTMFAWVQGEIYRSTDDGVTWLRCEGQPLRSSNVTDPWLLTVGRRLYASSDPGRSIYLSDDECASSRVVAGPSASLRSGETVSRLGGTLLATYYNTPIFASSDDGRAWTPLDAPTGVQPQLAVHDGIAYLIVSQRLYRSADRGATWTQLAQGGPAVGRIVSGGRSLYGAASGGLWRSDDGGQTWVHTIDPPFTTATARNSNVYVGVFGGIARSSDGGNTWTQIPAPLERHSAFALMETKRGTLIAGTAAGIFRWSEADHTWTATGVTGLGVRSLAAGDGRAYASLSGGGFWSSTDSGLTWSRVEMGYSGSPRPLGWPSAFDRLFLADGAVLRASTGRELVASADRGSIWSSTGLAHAVNALARIGTTWFAGTSAGVFRSDDFVHWTECSAGLDGAPVAALTSVADGDLVALAGYQLYRSTDACRSWRPLAGHPPTHSAVDSGSEPRPILVADPAAGIVVFGDGIAQFRLEERKWVARAALPVITAAVGDERGRYWLASREGVFRLSIEEAGWRLVPTGLGGPVTALALDPGGYLLAAIDGRGIFRARMP